MSFHLDMSLPSDQLLLNLINDENGTNFTFNDVKFHDRGVDTTDKYGKNSTIVLVALPTANWHGSRRFYYNRLQLNEYFKDQVVSVELDTFKCTEDLLDEVFEQLGINFSKKDVLNDIIMTGQTRAKVRVSPRCITYLGGIEIHLHVTFKRRIPNRVLDGFHNSKTPGVPS